MAGAKPAYIFAVSRQPAGNLVAAACCDGAVRLWSLRASGQLDWAGQVGAVQGVRVGLGQAGLSGGGCKVQMLGT